MIQPIPLALILLCGCSCAQGVKRLDPHAIQGNDLIALMSKGEEQVSVGYLVSRQVEGGDAATEFVTFYAPPQLECDEKDACLYFKIFLPDGRPTYEGSIKKGEAILQLNSSSGSDILTHQKQRLVLFRMDLIKRGKSRDENRDYL